VLPPIKKQPAGRHFPYQHPTFGTTGRPAPASKWKNTVYYWWWAYLRSNPLYLETCAAGGIGRCANLYLDFGDVRDDDFKAWWLEGGRGVRLFAEPTAEDMVRVLDEGEAALSPREALTVSLPLNFPKRLLEQRFRVLLAKHHKGERGRQHAKKSRAKFKVSGQPNVPALKLGFEVWQLRKSRPELKLWEIGNQIEGLLRTQKILPKDARVVVADKRRALAITVSRYLKRVESSITRAGEGEFP
jgi:hypothetical protein